MTRRISCLAVLTMVAALTGCGTTTQDRALSGAGIGAAAGLGVGVLTDADTLGATALGALGGAAVGALTSPDQINLGRPVWE